MNPTPPLAGEPSLDLLRTLAQLDTAPEAIVSLYLDCRWSDEQQRDRVSIPLRHEIARRRRDADDVLAAELDDLAEFVEARVKQRADVGLSGVARFLCRPLGVDVTVRTHLPLPTLLEIGTRPLIHPLAALPLDEHVLVVTADALRVRVRELRLGRLEERADVAGATPPRSSEGGWSQLKLQHWRKETENALHEAAAQEIARLFDSAPVSWVLVGGSVEGAANLYSKLPQRVRAHAISVDGLRAGEPPHEELERIAHALGELAVARERSRAERALERGVNGSKAVLEALAQGRVARALVSRLLPATLIESIARGALATDARIDLLVSDALDDIGAAALLRY
jgi:hypothetical protein